VTRILGISAYYHDSAAALVIDGEVISAAQEERFTRKKHDSSYPNKSITFLLRDSKLRMEDIDAVVFYDKPFLKFERLVETYISIAPKGLTPFIKAMPVWIKDRLFLKNKLLKKIRELDPNFDEKKLFFCEHHMSHAASAFYPSPFKNAVILTIDGVGEWATTTVSIGKSNKIKIKKEIHYPHSLGLLYSAFTYFLGFKVNSGEYKVMGLAPYGKPVFKEKILNNIVDLKEDGSFWLDQSYFDYSTGFKMTSNKFSSMFGIKPRKEENELKQIHMDIAASIQSVTEDILIKITRALAEEFKIENLCLAGGVGLNCVVNGKLLNDNKFKNIWIQPASGDAGGSIGAALTYWYQKLEHNRELVQEDTMKGTYLGPSFKNEYIENVLNKNKITFRKDKKKLIIEKTAEELSKGKAVAWFNGRMEFGPRALGNRSILGDPRSEFTQKNLNLKVKFRESFRPFAPAVLVEELSDWFELDRESPYMLIVQKIKESHRINILDKDSELTGLDKLKLVRSTIPAVTHVDFSARIQTVHKETNPDFHLLLERFYELTGFPLLVNTSFNIRGEPIVCSPEDAIQCFLGTDLDVLVMENNIVYKNQINPNLLHNYKDTFSLD